MAVPKLKRKRSNQGSVLQIILYACLVSLGIGAFFFMSLKESQDVQIASQNINTESSGTVKGTKDNTTVKSKVMSNEKGGFLKGSVIKESESLADNMSSDLPKTVTLKTSEGDIRIRLRPDLSLASVQYIQKLLESPKPCSSCRFYRAEKPGILQGILQKEGVQKNTVLGDCPEELKDRKHDCPEHDPNCGCHGPIMKQGMIGWAAGEGGPDFFIDSYKRDATWWNTDHTVWGELADKESLDVVKGFYELPATEKQLTFLDKAVHIELTTP